MADLACNMVYVYLAGCWSWLNRATAVRDSANAPHFGGEIPKGNRR